MQKVNAKDARKNISQLLDQINSGEEIIILRRGKPVARMSRVEEEKTPLRFPDRSDLRGKIPPVTQKSAFLIRDIRDERE